MRLISTIAAIVALRAGAASAAVRVESDSSCPSSEAVRVQLDALGIGEAAPSVSMMVRTHDDRMTIELAWPGEARPETRELTAASDCEARAQAAAVVAASWLGTLPGVSLQSQPLRAPPGEPQNAEAAPPPPTAAPIEPSSRTPRSVPPAPIPKPQPTVEPPQPEPALSKPATPPHPVAAPAAPEARRSWLGVGLAGSVGGGLVPGMRIELARLRASHGFNLGWMASAMVTTPRSASVADGTSKWIRPALGVAGLATWRSDRVQLGLDLGPLLGLTMAWGSGYPTNETDTSVTWGLSGGLRLQTVAPSSRYWIELRIIDWLRTESLQHQVLPSGSATSVTLPSVEGLLSVGWSFAL